MKTWRRFIFYVSVIVLFIAPVSCRGSSVIAQSNSSPATETAVGAAREDYIISGFDIRTIGEYPLIEKAVRKSSGNRIGELTKEDFLKVTEINPVLLRVEFVEPCEETRVKAG
jgi:hypothetical protein